MNAGTAGGGRRWRSLLWQTVIVTVLSGVLLFLGWWTGESCARHTDDELRAHLFRQATELAESIDPEWGRQLTFTSADRAMPAFDYIRNQMCIQARTLPLRGIYTMKLWDRRILFGPESYPENDPMASLPGAEYLRPPAEFHDVFRKQRSATVGPYTDEYGAFVSAAAPIVDPQNRQVLMAVGMDLLASDWQNRLNDARRLPWIVTLMLILFLAEIVILVRRRLRRAPPDVLRLRFWIVVPTAGAILIGILLYGAREIYGFNQASKRDTRNVVEQARSRWNRNLAAQVRIMRQRIAELEANPEVWRAWQQRDAAALLSLAKPMLTEMKWECGITALSFVAPDETVFRRIHEPDYRGDRLDRGATLAAKQAGGDAWGIELDRAGSLVLYYAMPWRGDAPANGHLELGLALTRLASRLAAEMKIDVAILCNKAYAARKSFAAEMGVRLAMPWETFPDLAVLYKTTEPLPGEVAQWIARRGGDTDREWNVFTARQGATRFACGGMDLHDTAGHELGQILVMRDVTAQAAMAWSALLLNLGFALVALLGVLILLWAVCTHAERQLRRSFARVHDSEAHYRALFETMADGVVHVASDGRIVEANTAAERMLRLRRSQIEGHKFDAPEWNLIHPDGRPMAREERTAGRAMRERRQVTNVESGVVRGDRSICWINTSASPLINAAGELEGAVATFTDITARKEAEDMQRLQRDLVVAVVDQDSLDGALQKLLEHVCRIPGVDCGGVYKVDGKTGRAVLLAHRSLSASYVAAVADVEPGSAWSRILLAGKPVYRSAAEIRASATSKLLVDEKLSATAVIPQSSEGQVVAALNLASRTLDDFPPASRLAIESTAALMGGAVARLSAQDAVRSARQNLETVFNTMGDMLFIVDESGRIVHTNRAAQLEMGYTAGEFAGLSLGDMHPPDRRDEAVAVFADMLAGRCDMCLIPLVRCDGRLIEVETRGQLGQWDGRKVVFGISRDVTVRRRAERELLRAKEDWERTFDAVPDMIALLDRDQRISRVNRAMAQRLQSAPEYSVGRLCQEIFMGLPAFREVCRKARMSAGVKQEYAEVADPGLGATFDIIVAPMCDLSGDWVGSVIVAHDVTARKDAERALRESEESFRCLAESALDGIMITAADGRHVYANPRAAEITGYDQGELLELHLRDQFMPSEYARIRQRMTDRLAGKWAPSRYETAIRHKDGAFLPIEVSAARTIWRGQPCVMVFFRDISARKRMENEILQIDDWEKKRIGQDLHDSLGQQLTGVAFLSQALAKTWKGQGQAATDEALARISTESRYALEQMRVIARGLTSIAPGPEGLVAALRGMVERINQIYGVSCEFQAEGRPLVGGRQTASHLFFLAQEAVTNAVRHGQARHVVVRLSQTGDSGELSIQDDGVGMPQDIPPGREGPGLGLRIMHYRADLIGGTLAIERVEGGGVRVRCRFPVSGEFSGGA